MVNPKYEPNLDNQWGLLAHAMEEAGEVVQIAGKTFRWGFESHNPEDPNEEINAHALIRELSDLQITAHKLLILLEERYPYKI